MTPIVVTHDANTDLFNLWLEIASHNPAAADKLLDKINRRIQLLAHMPQSGRPRPELCKGGRSIAFSKRLIVYRIHKDRVDILRIVHGAMDLNSLEFEPGD
jgi:toxin ParE1/3/4